VLRIPKGELPTQTQNYLDGQQEKIDALLDYAARVKAGKDRWDARMNTKKGKERFHEVRTALARLCPGARRCHYCEDSAADEIEHLWPKNFYLRQYVSDKQGGATEDELAAKRREIEGRHHPTIWREMIRIRDRVPALAALFAEAPEST